MNARGLGSQLKDSIPVTELSASGPFESYDLLLKGFSSVKNELLPSHPLELSEKNVSMLPRFFFLSFGRKLLSMILPCFHLLR